MTQSNKRRTYLKLTCTAAIALTSVGLLAGAGLFVRAGTRAAAITALGPVASAPTRPTLPITLPPTRDPEPTLPPSLTPTASPTATSTATPTPQPALLPVIWRSLRGLHNGDFEDGDLGWWTVIGDLPSTVVSHTVHDGRYAALLGDPNYDSQGGCPTGEAAIYQVFDVPSEGHPELRLWYRIHSFDTFEWDYFAVTVRPYPYGVEEQLWMDGRETWTPGVPWSSGWREATINLDNYRGQAVALRLYTTMTNGDGYYNTWTYVDDIRLEE